MKNRFKVSNVSLGPDEKTYFIADIAANHDGDLSRAKRLIELCKEAGADAAKFQNFQAPKIVSKTGFESLGVGLAHQAKWKKSVVEVYEDASISKDWTPLLKEHCRKVGIEYFTSPYDVESVDLVDAFVEAYKIGSGDITFHDILEHIASKGKPIFLATGASSWGDVSGAIDLLGKSMSPNQGFCLMQCNTNYTASLENFHHVNLRVLNQYREAFPDILLGLSDHTPGHATVLGAIALGARVVEKHFTDDNDREGPDHTFSMNPRSWREMVDRSRELEASLGDGKKRVQDNEEDSYIVQRRSLLLRKALRKGEVVREDDLDALRPEVEGGFKPFEKKMIVGKPCPRDFEEGEHLLKKEWV